MMTRFIQAAALGLAALAGVAATAQADPLTIRIGYRLRRKR
jgi:hypothetical protein